jgi:DNA end-binding protein Ku
VAARRKTTRSAHRTRSASPRVIWRGAITFGLVHVPVTLYPATRAHALDLDLIDKRDYAPVGYRHYNKSSGKDVARQDIVKGYEYRKGEYVVLSDEDFRRANPKATQTVEIRAFLREGDIPTPYYDTPYYLEPDKGGDKGYALLRAAMRAAGRVALATLVVRNRQHFAAVSAGEDVLLLTTLRYADEIRPASGLRTPSSRLRSLGVTAREVEMAEQLIEDMAGVWKPGEYKDTYRDDLLARIRSKVRAGRKHVLSEPEPAAEERPSAQVIDLVAQLKKSLRGGKGTPEKAPARAARRARHARSHGRARGRHAA